MINFSLLLRVRDVVDIHGIAQANTAISLVILAFSLPSVLFGPVAGVVADRFNKRLLMSILNFSRAVAVALFLVIQPQWHVETILAAYYLVTFLFGIAGQFWGPVEGSTIPLLVPRTQLLSANGLFNITVTAAQLLGFAAVGPILVKVIGIDRLFEITIFAYIVCAGVVWTLPRTPVPKDVTVDTTQPAMQRLWEDIKEGLLYILHDPALMKAIGYLTLAATTFLMIAALGPDFVTAIIGLSKEDIGYIVAPAGAGVLLGVFTVPKVVRVVGRDWLIDSALTAAGVLLGMMALSRAGLNLLYPGNAPVTVVALVVAGLAVFLGMCNAFVLVPAQTLLQERSHETVRARVYATFFTISNSVSFIPIFFAAASADLFGVVEVLVVVAILVASLGMSSLIHRRAAEIVRWHRVKTRHRQGPESLPIYKR
jgi:Na+/melibiose symporter-like transporter